MKFEIEHGQPVIHMDGWKVRFSKTSDGFLDINLHDNKMSCMKVVPQSGNVIRIKPDPR